MPNWKDMQSEHSPFRTLLLSFDTHSALLQKMTDVQHHRVSLEMNQSLNDHIMQYNRDREQNQSLNDHIMQYNRDREQDQTLNDHIMQYNRDREQILQNARERHEDLQHNQYVELKKWLQSPGEEDSEEAYQIKNINKRKEYEGTGDWFLDEEPIRDWVEAEMPEFPILWVHGKWGTGMSFITF